MGLERYEALEQEFIARFDREGASEGVIDFFREIIWSYFAERGRHDLPWRQTRDPYRILVSEIMLQQTQVPRVLVKYREFLEAFPSFEALAEAPLSDVLQLWQGLGYNRRAVNLKRAAETVVTEYGGTLPADFEELKKLPGIGPATAAGIYAFAFEKAVPYIETNIRSVYIHFFFHDRTDVTDRELQPLIDATLDRGQPREWYYALMDYGHMLKKTRVNPSRRSAHHKVQSRYEGSNRKLRADALRVVLGRGMASAQDVAAELGIEMERAEKVLGELEKEGFVKETGKGYAVP